MWIGAGLHLKAIKIWVFKLMICIFLGGRPIFVQLFDIYVVSLIHLYIFFPDISPGAKKHS